MSFTVAIVGRPNVGKSTIFNRLIERQKAIVDDLSGVTRDRQYNVAEWCGKSFDLIDTGGFVDRSKDIFEKEIRKQVVIALDEASLIIFVVDVTTGITALDDEMAALLRRSKKPVLLMVNKVDNHSRGLSATEFYSLGFEHTFFVSSLSGSGTGEMLDELIKHIPDDAVWDSDMDDLPKIAIVGQPNVGKSSMLNALVGKERTIVSPISGTTRDTIHTRYTQFGKDFVLVDTAGLRKKSKVHEDLEFYSVIRAIKALDEADVCMLMIDAKEGFTSQDVNIFSLATRKGKGVVIVVNKWDLIEKETMTSVKFEEIIREKISPFKDVPIVFTSVKDKQRIMKAIEVVLEVVENRNRKITTSKLNDIMLREIERFPPPIHRGNSIKIKYCTQLPVVVPSFAFYTNYPKEISGSYTNFIENKIREHFEVSGVPVRVFFREK